MKLKITPDAVGKRLDAWLVTQLPELSRARIQALIKSGHITADDHTIKPHQKLADGMQISVTIPLPVATEIVPQNMPLAVLFEDHDIIAVNKPAGIVVHPAAGHADGTLVNALLHHCGDLAGIGGEYRPGIVHRPDKDTSGALVVAKNEQAMAGLVSQFKKREVRKEYLAIVWGVPQPPTGRVETMVGRSTHDRKKMTALPRSGRHAVTEYSVIEAFVDTALLKVTIKTGRTHQIRVHMSHMQHPIVGDKQYGRKRNATLHIPVERQMLHAEHLTIKHPRTHETMTFQAPVPNDMQEVLKFLRE